MVAGEQLRTMPLRVSTMAVIEYASMPTNLTELQVRDVAARQKQIIYCILAYFGLVVVMLTLPLAMRPFAGLGFLALFVLAALSFFRLAIKFHHPVMASFMLIGMIIPLINLLLLLSINGKATQLLKQNGIKVGMLGAQI